MTTVNKTLRRFVGACVMVPLLFAIISPPAFADSGKPVALRWWGDSWVSIETYWNFHIVLGLPTGQESAPDQPLKADVVCTIGNFAPEVVSRRVMGKPLLWQLNAVDNAADAAPDALTPTTFVLDRLPNSEQSTWRAADPRQVESEHAVRVTALPIDGQDRARQHAIVVDVDGVRIVYASTEVIGKAVEDPWMNDRPVDALVLKLNDAARPGFEQAIKAIRPRRIVPLHDKDWEQGNPAIEALRARLGVSRVDHVEHGNTVALIADKDVAGKSARRPDVLTILGTHSSELPQSWESLFAKMDRASQATEELFRPLTVEQMNFRPSNGTHTPRWNAEHMMGRQLGFFTQIFHELDPSIPHLDLNPQQNPPDYVAAHPDWTGAEEARQIARVRALTRRFSYLLDGLDLEQKAPGSFWTPLGLLVQMERHYDEHTDNVKKKFELPDWPNE